MTGTFGGTAATSDGGSSMTEAVCCFAHEEAELRSWAAERYSWRALSPSTSEGRARTSSAGTASTADTCSEVPAPFEDFQVGALSPSPTVRSSRHPRSWATGPRRKMRFCVSYPDVAQCWRGAVCEFAHSREEATAYLLTPEQEQQVLRALTEDFFLYDFKTRWCPIGVQHEWQSCVYAHNHQDARRHVSIGYGPQPCPYWAKKAPNAEYNERCPNGLWCPYAHGAKEQLYHPQYFRTVICRDLRNKVCPRQQLCAFYHRRSERRRRRVPADVDYSQPLPEKAWSEAWVEDFLSPPFGDVGTPSTVVADDTFSASMSEGASAWSEVVPEDVLDNSFDESWFLDFLDPVSDCSSDDDVLMLTDLQLSRRHLQKAQLLEDGATPRTQIGESDPADDSSSSISRDVLAIGDRAPGAGIVSVSSQARCAPGPFAGPLGAFPGFLAAAAGNLQQQCTQ
eukprot:TRINITY_DN14888_c0_g1_i1.p1 TRINITY_DN14888_c0_g1~~TRINITY_DN14888_c0_g1_i1.p1  ORF type:complete len:453 (-),score=56.43 TRINITY_DN14888_c0_g1_i1:146-1504(-)